MKKSKFSDTQIGSILKQAEAGMPVKEVCRQGLLYDLLFSCFTRSLDSSTQL